MQKINTTKKNAILAPVKNLKTKAKAVVDEDEDEDEEEEEVAPAPRKRGRPAKVKAAEVAAPPAKKRGRPAKVKAAEVAAEPVKAKKGLKKSKKAVGLAEEDETMVGSIVNVPLDEISLSEDIELTDEIKLDDKVLDDLCKAIPKEGLLNPLTVALIDGEYQLIAGRHRLEALKRIRDKKANTFKRLFKGGIPVNVATTDVGKAKFLRVSENLNRRTLNSVEIAAIVHSLGEEGVTTADIAKAFGKSPSWVLSHNRLYEEATDELKERLQSGNISFNEALKLMKVAEDEQAEAADEVASIKKGKKHGRTGGAAEAAVAKRTGKAVVLKPSKKQLVNSFNNLVQKAISKSSHDNAGEKRYSLEEIIAMSAQTLRYVLGEIDEDTFKSSINKPKLTLKTILGLGGAEEADA